MNEESQQLRMVIVAAVVVALAGFGMIAAHAINGQNVNRDLAKVCIQGGHSWVQNANREFECRTP
jgi:hypothetical protein